jgi:hypothetical protein
MQTPPCAVRELVTGIVPADELEWAHRSDVLRWLESTQDIYRRQKPATPPKLDQREFTGGRWWTAAEIESADPALFDPHLGRFITKVRATIF